MDLFWTNYKYQFSSFFVFFIVLLISYSPMLLTEWGHADDFDSLHKQIIEGTNKDLFLGNMRPIYALIGDLPFFIVQNKLSDFWILRTVYIFLLSISCLITSAIFVNLGISRSHSLFLALVIGLSPAAQGMASFGIMCFAPLGTIFSALAFKSLLKISEKFFTVRTISNISVSIALLYFSLSTYSVYALFFWVFVLVEFILKFGKKNRPLFKNLTLYFFVFGMSSIMFLALNKNILPAIFDYQLSERIKLTDNFFYGLLHFIARPFRDSINLIFLSYYGPFSADLLYKHLPSYLSAFTVLGMSIYLHWKSKNDLSGLAKVFFLVVCFALICCSMSIHLLVEKHFYPYRVQYALFSTMLVFIYFAIRELCKQKHKVITIFLIFYVFLAATFCYRQINSLIIYPNEIEWNYIKNQVSQGLDEGHKSFYVICPTEKMKRSKPTINGDFGMSISLTPNGRLKQMVILALVFNGEETNEYDIILSENFPKPFEEKSETIIDMRTFFLSPELVTN